MTAAPYVPLPATAGPVSASVAQVNLIPQLPAIGDQGRRGSCVAFATLAAYEHFCFATVRLQSFPEQFLVLELQRDRWLRRSGAWPGVAYTVLVDRAAVWHPSCPKTEPILGTSAGSLDPGSSCPLAKSKPRPGACRAIGRCRLPRWRISSGFCSKATVFPFPSRCTIPYWQMTTPCGPAGFRTQFRER